MLIRMNRLVSKYWKLFASLLFGVAVFLYWWLASPALLSYHEQFQLFLMDGGYLCQLLRVPDGLARCIGEYLVQFYINHALGALVLAVALVLLQRLMWRLMQAVKGHEAATHYVLSFLPSVLLWLMLGDESVLLTFVVAMVLAATAMWLYELTAPRLRVYLIIVLVPLLYWLAGPVVLMLAAYVALRLLQTKTSKVTAVGAGLLVAVYALACIIASSQIVPYTLTRLFQGVDYYRFSDVYYTLYGVLMALCVLVPVVVKWLPSPSKPRVQAVTCAAEGLVLLVAFLLLRPSFFDARKYEVMEYDYLVRCNRWTEIIAKAERKTPDLPITVCANNLALGIKGQLGDRAFEFYQNGIQGLLPQFERNFSTLLLPGEVYWQLGLVNTAQRYAFEAMEGIPNYNKSCRAIQRLAETNLVNGQYVVARKYLQLLEKTLGYRKWAKRMMALLGDEKAINAHPVYGRMREIRLKDDFLFSEQELDKMMGQLLMHSSKNGMALQYLLLCPLLERDINTFMNYMSYVDGLHLGYRPRTCQEAVVFAFAQRKQQPPQGFVDRMVLNSFGDFIQTYNGGPAALERFKNTTWYYLTVGR